MKKETLWQRFWRMVALFAWRRWWRPPRRMPVGLPGVRDPDSRCDHYSPTYPVKLPMLSQCRSDGHYLCKGCMYLHPETRAELEEPT